MGALVAAAALAAGCGSDEEANSYVDEVNAIQTALVADVNEVAAEAPPANAKAVAAVAADLRAVFERNAAELERIEPPEEVADLHAQLATAVGDVAERIGEAERTFERGDPQQAAKAALELQTATTELQGELSGLIDQINARALGLATR